MKTFWNRRNTRSEIFEEMEKDKAQPWDKAEPKSHILTGVNQVFIFPPEYDIIGYSLTLEDLEELLTLLRPKLPDQVDY